MYMIGFIKEIKNKCLLLLIFCNITLVYFICVKASSSQVTNKYISNTLGIDLPKDIAIKLDDTHGGFHGDGTTFTKIEFKDKISEDIKTEIENNNHWSKLPLSENIHLIMYGGTKGTHIYLYNLAKQVGLPMVRNGYWIFIDRYGNNHILNDDKKLFDRGSFNFTISIYDTNNNVLYYFEFDT